MGFLTKHSTANNPVLRIAAAVLFVIMPLVGFAVGMQYQAAIDSPNLIYAPSIIKPFPKPTPVPGKTYASEKLGFAFNYPDNLVLSEKNNIVDLYHSIPYKNSGGCDMSGNVRTYDNLTDFHVAFEIKPGKIVPSYTDGTYKAGNLSGVWQYEGAEGCGNNIYYLYLPNNKTLVVTREQIQAFSGISSMWNAAEILKVPGAISKEENDKIFNGIVSSLNFPNYPHSAEAPQGRQLPATNYHCPSSGWVDCMPGPDKDMSQCSKEALAWYQANCPGFQGAAQ